MSVQEHAHNATSSRLTGIPYFINLVVKIAISWEPGISAPNLASSSSMQHVTTVGNKTRVNGRNH